MADAQPAHLTIPEGFRLHTENTAHVLLPEDNEAFLNPVQEFNRDMSVACIKVWSEDHNKAKEKKWRDMQEYGKSPGKGKSKLTRKAKKSKINDVVGETVDVTTVVGDVKGEQPTAVEQVVGPIEGRDSVPKTADESPAATVATAKLSEYTPYRFTLLEPLSATGLRAIRYAKEIPLVKYVIANDLSPAAVEAIKRNVELNGLGPQKALEETDHQSTNDANGQGQTVDIKTTPVKKFGKVRINEGDACALMYSHVGEHHRVDCVDLDPYGTAAPFIDAAVQCINHEGLLCITCTDLAVLATNNYPEKCFSNYGGVPVKAEYCHEVALRLVLNTISTSAARYGRYITPLLSLSIDFYVRLFVKIGYQPIEVKKAVSKTSTFYVCSSCQSFYEQPLGKMVEKVSEKTGQTNLLFKQRAGPPVSDRCPECDGHLHIAGPMWNGQIQDTEFVGKVLEHVEANRDKYGTSTRMQGMLTVAKEELHTPFYFSPGRIAGLFHCISPSLEEVTSALLNAGHPVSRSHAMAGSLKTTATRQDVHDVFRGWIEKHPVKPESISPTSPSHNLHAKQPTFKADFTKHPQSVTQSSKVKLVRYQPNPTSNWGPGTKAKSKRKRDEVEE